MNVKYEIRGLDCANCAAKIETQLRRLPGVRAATIDFATQTLFLDADDAPAVCAALARTAPDVTVTPRTPALPGDRAAQVSASLRRELSVIVISALLFLALLLGEEHLHTTPYFWVEYLLTGTVYLLAGQGVLRGALRTIRTGALFDENVLMTIATLGALAIHAYAEAAGVMLFFRIGESLQNRAVARSRHSIRALLAIRPDHANRQTPGGWETVSPEEVAPGETILVKPGEKVPLDGIVRSGSSHLNLAALTGESAPAACGPGDAVLAGAVNLTGLLTLEATRRFADSAIARILDLVENAAARKTKTEQFITRFARYYTPAVVGLAAAVALAPPLLAGEEFSVWIYRALVLLVISCPCALMVSVPLGYFGGIGGASRRGILVKGSNFLDALADVTTVVFDKTGTLTRGEFEVLAVRAAAGWTEEAVLRSAALAEAHSNHPVARSVRSAAQARQITPAAAVEEHEEQPGLGVRVRAEGKTILAGNAAWLARAGVRVEAAAGARATEVHLAVDGAYAGCLQIGDALKPDARRAVHDLRAEGVQRIVMLTGDSPAAAEAVAAELRMDACHAGLLPEDKIHCFEVLAAQNKRGKIAFVGDGVNDAPVLARADVGVAMGALGSEAAIETADVVLMTDHPSRMVDAIRIGRRTRQVVWQNIVFALTVKVVFLAFGSFGLVGMWEAVFADMGTALLAVLNASRTLRTPRPEADDTPAT